MAFFDMPLDELRSYVPEINEPDDFDAFWTATLREVEGPLDIQCERVRSPLRLVDVYDISWLGSGGHRVRGWMLVPQGLPQPRPAVVEFGGYSAGRGEPFDRIFYALGGFVHFVIDARGQGWSNPTSFPGTSDPEPRAPGEAPGVLTRGILSEETYYYRRLFVDAVRLVQAASTFECVDAGRIAVAGSSQGAGMALAATALAPLVGVHVAATFAAVPFLCHFPRAVGLADVYPYKEISDYLAAFPHYEGRVMRTLSYFDGVSMARRGQTPALFTVGLMDQISPPSTVFAAYNHYGGPKDIRVYKFNGHEGGRSYQVTEALWWLQEQLGTDLELGEIGDRPC